MSVRRRSRDQPLLEREAELEALIGLARRAASGEGGVAVVEGPAGIGKTALVEHAVERIRDDGVSATVARGGELERDLPWGVVRDLFERLLGGFTPGERETLFTGAAGLAWDALYGETPSRPRRRRGPRAALHGLYWLTSAVAERGPMVIAVDDAQWADSSSLRFVGYLAARVEELPVAAHRCRSKRRAGGVRPNARRDRRASMDDPGAALPAGEGATARSSRRRSGAPAGELGRACYELTAGNPFYLTELMRGLQRATTRSGAASTPARSASCGRGRSRRWCSGGWPGSRRGLWSSRARSRCSGRGPRSTRPPDWQDLESEDAARTADALVAADVLRAELPLEFVHPLVKHVVYSDIPPVERSVRHAGPPSCSPSLGPSPQTCQLTC